MSRIDRLKEYAAPTRKGNWEGQARDQSAIDRWSDRASENSQLAPRSTGMEQAEAHSTGKSMDMRDTAMKPREARNADARMTAKADTNTAGDSPYLRGVRRQA